MLDSDDDAEEELENTPCTKCGDIVTPLHINGKCGNCWPKLTTILELTEREYQIILDLISDRRVEFLNQAQGTSPTTYFRLTELAREHSVLGLNLIEQHRKQL